MGNCQNCLHHEEEQVEIVANPTEVEVIDLPEQEQPQLVLDVKTWQKESYSLYDYESSSFINSQQFSITGSIYLTCKANKVTCINGNYVKNNDNDEALLFILESDNNQYQLLNLRFNRRLPTQEIEDDQKEEGDKLFSENQTVHADFQREFNIQKLRTNTNRQLVCDIAKGSKIWLVTRSVQANSQKDGLALKVGDVIKLGRVKLIIKAIKLDIDPLNKALDNDNESMRSVEDPSENCKQCRICLSTGQSTNNPFIDPCKCQGSTKYVHINCLLEWIRQSSHFNCNAFCTRFIWKSLDCEICKAVYPPIFEREGKTYNLIELSKPKDKPYIVMEFQQKRQHDNSQTNDNGGLYIVNFGTKKELKIGRNHEVEISIPDISVSREHASLKLVDNKVILSDKRSKFGTLVLLQKNIQLTPQLSGLELQIKRTLIKFNHPQAQQSQRDFEQHLGRYD